MQDVSDEVLISRVVKSDDRHAFATLVKRHQSDVRGTLGRLCNGQHAMADDLAQEVFIKLYRYLPSFKGHSQFKTWLYRICLNCFFNEQKKHVVELFENDEEQQIVDKSNVAEQYQSNRDINAALAQLSDGQKLMIELNLIRGFSHQEIVEITGVPVGTVKSHIQRGRLRLQALLQDWAEN